MNEQNYTKVENDTKRLKEEVGKEIIPPVNEYEGFTSPSVQMVTVAEDGSTVVKYYYERYSYELKLKAGDNITAVEGAGTYHYGKQITINATLAEIEGYEITFDGWYLGSNKNQKLAQRNSTGKVIII